MYTLLFLCCVAFVNAQLPAARSVYAAAVGTGNNRACYVVSAQYAVVPNTSVVGNVFVWIWIAKEILILISKGCCYGT
jgi:hypothetical protein